MPKANKETKGEGTRYKSIFNGLILMDRLMSIYLTKSFIIQS